MGTPISSMRYIHKAICTELDALAAAASGLESRDAEQLAQFRDRFRFLRLVVRGHADGEEVVLYPALESKAHQALRRYVLDHPGEEGMFLAIEELLAASRDVWESDKGAELARQLYLQASTLKTALDLHILIEEEHLVPLVEAHFSIGEQGALVSRMNQYLPMAQMPRIVPWMVQALTVDEREDQLRTVMQALTPDQFQSMAGWARAGLPAEEWAELVRRIPELASVPG